MARERSVGHQDGDCYEAIADAHCDGFEITLDVIPMNIVTLNKDVLENYIQQRAPEITIKNVLYHTRNHRTILWFTISPETAHLTPRTIKQIMNVVDGIKKQAREFWMCDEESVHGIYISKIDVAVDFEGSFIPDSKNPPYHEI